MSCEHVKGLLSAYFDNELTSGEQDVVHTHLQGCSRCQEILEDYRHFNTLLTQLPRVSPSPMLRYTTFSSPSYLKLIGNSSAASGRYSYQWRVIQVLVAACLLLILTIGSLVSLNVLKQPHQVDTTVGGIMPPDAPQQGPIPAGIRFVFLRDNVLWSAPTDGSTEILRLSPSNTRVAAHWAVRPALSNHQAGNILAYIDLQHAHVHIIRSDGQSDKILQPALLKAGVQPSTVWNTSLGSTILTSLCWSQDGTMLAFIADPQGTGKMALYLYSINSGTTHAVPLPLSGSISHLAWSPDNLHLAFTVSQGATTTLLDYITQDHGLLTVAPNVNTAGQPGDTLQSLDWSPAIDIPTLTWSIGSAGHIHSLWAEHTDAPGTPEPLAIAEGDYIQASYTQNGCAGSGCWLLVNAHGDLSSVDSITDVAVSLTDGKQVITAQWSPDGKYINYLDREAGAIGTLHVINTLIGSDTTLASHITGTPAPTWSPDGQQIAYSDGTHILVVNAQNLNKTAQSWQLQGLLTTLSWSVGVPQQLVVATSDSQQGIYLADPQHSNPLRLDQQGMSGPIAWTQIP